MDILKGNPDVKGDSFTVIADLSHVFSNLSDCGFRQPYIDIAEFCDDTHMYDTYDQTKQRLREANLCTFQNATKNLQEQAFVAMGKASNMWDAIQHFPANSDAQFQE